MASDADTFPYRSATAFRAALRDRLTVLARSGGPGLDELQRQVAYDRVLARASTAPDADSWVLKGAGALLARLPEARHSRDIDLLVYGTHADRHRSPQADGLTSDFSPTPGHRRVLTYVSHL